MAGMHIRACVVGAPLSKVCISVENADLVRISGAMRRVILVASRAPYRGISVFQRRALLSRSADGNFYRGLISHLDEIST